MSLSKSSPDIRKSRFVVLFGGSFDPPHVGHIQAVKWLLRQPSTAEVWCVPTYRHALGKALTSFEHRCEMLERAISVYGNEVRLERVEAEMEGISHTIDTVELLIERHPDRRFSLAIGSDILLENHKWKDFNRIESLVPLLVFNRRGFHSSGHCQEADLPEVSSSEIRALFNENRGVECRDLVPDDVYDYIEMKGLYIATKGASHET